MIALLLTVVLMMQEPAALSPEARALIASVAEAIAAEEARQAALPPPANDRERLERMGALDQAGRMKIGEVNVAALPPDQRAAAFAAISAVIDPVDQANQQALLGMVPAEGWFLRSRYGDQAASAAFHIVQHGSEALWRRFLPVLEPLVRAGEVEGEAYAMMYDRLAVSEDRPQRYGTQFVCVDSRWTLAPLEDDRRVDEWRADLEIAMPLTVYLEHMADAPPCA